MPFHIFPQFRNVMGNVRNAFRRVVPIQKRKIRSHLKKRKSKLREDVAASQQTTHVNNRIDQTGRESCSNSSNANININESNEYVCSENSSESKVAEVGSLPKRLLLRKETMTFMIHRFADVTKRRGQFCLSPELKAHGYTWRLQVYPRGNDHSNETSEHLSCFLHYFASPQDRQAPVARAEYVCGVYKTATQLCGFTIEPGKRSCCWGLENFVERDRVIRNSLDQEGTLTIQVNLQIAVDRRAVWYPSTMRQEPTLLQLYDSIEETGDATFRLTFVSNKKDYSSSRSQSCQHYKAHKMILALRARILYELVCEESLPEDEEDDYSGAAVDLPGVDPEEFEALLKHIYTIEQPIIRDEMAGRKLLVAADRFCLTSLKMYVESVLVDRFTSSHNAASLLLFADAHSCALLKERTMDLYADDPASVVRSEAWPLVQESNKLLSELSKHVHTGCAQNFRQNNDLDVFSLRERLGEHGLCVDGSQETLLGRWTEW
eukprot:CAMPEP_0116155584 /NCGR_PEP_ID=MMETSP0329-20121206/22386_1 /TAXON_ID=697910 /ORGANISM="Pseudo-nitzschia arenysensis, Strain B593" /LENGTH=490 /DNA_ID=CAMNT_0003652629 /DNA_START=151 /DNA_END=1620 /DNA_ORIENTATION=+